MLCPEGEWGQDVLMAGCGQGARDGLGARVWGSGGRGVLAPSEEEKQALGSQELSVGVVGVRNPRGDTKQRRGGAGGGCLLQLPRAGQWGLGGCTRA